MSTSPRPAHQPPRPHLPGGDDPDGYLAHRRHEQHCPRPEDPHLFRSRAPPQRGKARGAPRHLQGQGTGRGGAITAEWGSLASVLCQPRSAGLLVVPKQVCKPLPKRVGCHQLRREPVGSQPCGDSPAQLSALPTGPCHGLSSEHRVNPSHASPMASRSPEQVPALPLPPRVAAGVTVCQMLLPCPPLPLPAVPQLTLEPSERPEGTAPLSSTSHTRPGNSVPRYPPAGRWGRHRSSEGQAAPHPGCGPCSLALSLRLLLLMATLSPLAAADQAVSLPPAELEGLGSLFISAGPSP